MEAKDTVAIPGSHSESIWCPHCSEEFGIEDKVQYEREVQAETSFEAGIKKGLARREYPLEAPCVFCGYNGIGYWQKETHAKNCPFFGIGSIADRQAKLEEWRIEEA